MDQEKSPEWLIDNITEASKNARGIYFLFIGFLAYCSLTLFGISDRGLTLNEIAKLPILNTEIPLFNFFIITPFLALFIFIYLQLYLLRINGLIKDLRSNYANIEKRRLYPWMLNIAEDPEPGLVGRLQKIIANFSLWWLLPIVLMLFPLRFIKKHDPSFTIILGLIPLIGTFIVIWFWCKYDNIKMNKIIHRNPGKISLAIIVLLFTMIFNLLLIPWAFNATKAGFLKSILYVDLSYQVLINEQNKEYTSLYWADFAGYNLQGANLRGSILKKADLRNSNLRNAILDDANIEGACLDSAQLQGASLINTNLQDASLITANLLNTNLRFAQLDNANLEGIQLSHANLIWAKLKSVNLNKAILINTNFTRAILKKAQLVKTELHNAIFEKSELDSAVFFDTILDSVNLFGASLQGAFLAKAHLGGANLGNTNFTYANLQDAILRGAQIEGAKLEKAWLKRAQLQHANLMQSQLDSANLSDARLDSAFLIGASLTSADLKGVNLNSADLRDAQLLGSKNLNFGMLSTVKTLYQAKLDSSLFEEIKRRQPSLLEKPE